METESNDLDAVEMMEAEISVNCFGFLTIVDSE